MLDIKLIRNNPEVVKEGLRKKGYNSLLVDQLVPLEAEVRDLQTKFEILRAERNKVAALGPHAAPQGRKIKEEIEVVNDAYTKAQELFQALLLQVPNLPSDDTPIGEGESANTVVKTVGDKPAIDQAKDHVELGEALDLIDLARAVKISGSRFTFLKNQAVFLEFALVQLALRLAQKHDYTPMIPPQLVNEAIATGTGYLSKDEDAETMEAYSTQDSTYLIGTSEMPLVAYHKDEVLLESRLPIRYVGFSTCFRREAGSYGKDTKGIIRLHQFDKVELVSLVKPEDSEAELARILSLEEELMQQLGLPYQVVQIGTGDLGMQAAKKFDIETWMPGQNKYRETHSCSNTTDFQSRRLNIRYKNSDGKNEFVHTLNGTAIAVGRMLVALLENGQQSDGSVVLPQALAELTGFERIS